MLEVKVEKEAINYFGEPIKITIDDIEYDGIGKVEPIFKGRNPKTGDLEVLCEKTIYKVIIDKDIDFMQKMYLKYNQAHNIKINDKVFYSSCNIVQNQFIPMQNVLEILFIEY